MVFNANLKNKDRIKTNKRVIRILIAIMMIISTLAIISLVSFNASATAILSIEINPSDTSSKTIYPNGPSVTYQIDITNYGQGGNINVTNSTPPTGWTCFLDQTLVYLDGTGGSTTVTLTVDCPNTATSISKEGQYAQIIVTANEVGAGPENAKQITTTSTIGQEYSLSLVNKTGDPYTKSPDEFGKAEFDLTVNNTGNGKEYITWQTTDAPGTVVISPGYVNAFTEKDFNLRISNIPEDITKGIHSTKVVALSENTTISAEFNVEVYVEAIYDLTLNLNETKAYKDVLPGESNTFNFTVTNDGNTKDNMKVTTGFKSAAAGWSLLLNTQNEFSINQDETKGIQIEVSAPSNQSYPFTVPIFVNCGSKSNTSIFKNTTVNAKIEQINKIKLDMPLVKTLDIDTFTAIFLMNVSNTGNGMDTINFDPIPSELFPDDEIWSYDFIYDDTSISSITIPSDESREVLLNFTSPENPKKGSFQLYINASSDNDESQKVSKKITISVKDRFNIELISISGTQHSAYPGETIPIQIQGKNIGNVEGTFNLNIKKPFNAIEWETPVFEPPVFLSMSVDEVRLSYLNITVDNDAQKGFYLFIVNATRGSGQDLEIYDSFVLNISVKRKYEVQLSVDDPVLNAVPGTPASFEFTIQNKGTGSCNVTMEATMGTEEATWLNVKISPSSFELPTALASQTVWVNVTPSASSPLAPMNLSGVQVTITADITEKIGTPDASKEINIKINQTYSVETYAETLHITINPGETTNFNVTITNKGNGQDSYGVYAAATRSGWVVTPTKPNTEKLNQDDEEKIMITFEVPTNEVPISDTISVEVVSRGDATKSIIENITVKINIIKGVKLTTLNNRKACAPGKFVVFNITVENTGTVNDTYKLTISDAESFIDILDMTSEIYVVKGSQDWVDVKVSINGSDVYKPLPSNTNITLEATSKTNIDITYDFVLSLTIIPERDVDLSSTDLEKEGEPQDILTFNFTVTNTGTDNDLFKIKVIPGGYSQYATLSTDKTRMLESNEFEYIELQVKIPKSAAPTEPTTGRSVIVYVWSDEDETANETITLITHVEQVFKLKLTTVITTQTLDPGENTTYQVNVKNEGTGIDNIELDYQKTQHPENIKSISFNKYFLTLLPGQTESVIVTVEIVKEPEEGKLLPKIDITVTSLNDTTDTPETDSKEIQVEINPTVDIELQVDKIKKDIVPNLSGTKAEVEYTVTVWNRGLGSDSFDITEYNNHGYLVEISPTTTNKIDPDQSAVVTVKIKIDNKASMSLLDYNTTITVTSRTNDEKSDIITLKTKIKQAYGVELQVLDDSVETDDIFVGNNRIVTFYVDVQNIGTGDDTFKLELSGTKESWASLSKSYLTLDSKDNQTVTVRVKIPRESAIGDISIDLKAISRGDDDKYDSSDAFDEDTLKVEVTQFFEVSLTTPETLISGLPGDNIDFTVTITNRGNGDDSIEVRKKLFDPDWVWTISPSKFSLKATGDGDGGDIKEITLSVDIPTDKHGKSGYYNISIFVYSVDTPEGQMLQNNGEPLLFTVKVDPEYEVDMILDYPTTSTEEKADPGRSIEYQFTIKNKGNTVDTYTITVSGAKSGWVNLPTRSLTIQPFKSTKLNLTVDIPALGDVDADEIEADKYTITFKVTSEGDSDVKDEQDIQPSVNKKYDIVLETDELQLDASDAGLITVDPNIEPGYERFTLTLKNYGNTRDTVSLSTRSSDWTVKFDNQISKSVIVDLDATVSITVEISAPDDVSNGETEKLTITAKSADGKTKETFIVKPTIETAEIKFGELTIIGDKTAGSKVTVKLIVRNIGDVDAEDVEIKFYDKDKSNVIHTELIDKISKEGEEVVQFTYEIKEGDHDIKAESEWLGETVKQNNVFSAEKELLSQNTLLMIMIVGLVVVFIVGVIIASMSYSRGIPPDLKEEIALAKQAKRMGKSEEEIQDMRRKRMGKMGADKKKPGMGTASGFDKEVPLLPPGEEEEKEAPRKKGKGKVMRIKCPKCDKIQTVTSAKRPIEFPCTNCGMKLVLKK